jgi:hypothetical protein
VELNFNGSATSSVRGSFYSAAPCASNRKSDDAVPHGLRVNAKCNAVSSVLKSNGPTTSEKPVDNARPSAGRSQVPAKPHLVNKHITHFRARKLRCSLVPAIHTRDRRNLCDAMP